MQTDNHLHKGLRQLNQTACIHAATVCKKPCAGYLRIVYPHTSARRHQFCYDVGRFHLIWVSAWGRYFSEALLYRRMVVLACAKILPCSLVVCCCCCDSTNSKDAHISYSSFTLVDCSNSTTCGLLEQSTVVVELYELLALLSVLSKRCAVKNKHHVVTVCTVDMQCCLCRGTSRADAGSKGH